MPLHALVVANSEESNNRVAHAIRRELRNVEDISYMFRGDLANAKMAIAASTVDIALLIADAPSIGNNFNAVAKILPNRPMILLQKDVMLDDQQATKLGIDPALIINRPFNLNALSEKVQIALKDQVAPPADLRGLFTNKACTNVFFDGRPLDLMETERDVLLFLMRNETKDMTMPQMVQTFRAMLPAVAEYKDSDVQQVLQTFSRRLEIKIAGLTDGAYDVKREVDSETKQLKRCALVCRAA